MTEVERVLPPDDAIDASLDKDILARHFEEAFRSLLPYVIRGMTSPKVRVIYRPQPNGFSSILVSLPTRYSQSFWDELHRALSDGVGGHLTDYLWRCGTPKLTLRGENPDQTGWAYFVIAQHVVTPLYQELADAMDEQMVRYGALSKPWISEERVQRLAQHIADQWVNDTKRVAVSYFSRNLELVGLERIELGHGFAVRAIDSTDLCLYLTKYSEKILWDETVVPMFAQNGLVEITFDVPRSMPSSGVLEEVKKRLNVLRVAVSALKPESVFAGEGLVLVLVQDPSAPHQIHRLLRDDCSQWTPLRVDQGNRHLLEQRLQLMWHWTNQLTDVDRAIWRFGRAAVADTAGDRLTESVVGLETLLVPSSGELRYRFSLHGTALLLSGTEDPSAVFEELGRLYDLRSRSVHGQGTGGIADEASRALLRLVQAIDTVTQLYDHGLLSQERVAEGIQQSFLSGVRGLRFMRDNGVTKAK